MINNKLLYLIEGVNEYTERRSIRILMNSRLSDFFFLAINSRGGFFYHCISDSKPDDIKIQVGNKNRILRFVNIESLGYYYSEKLIPICNGQIFTEPICSGQIFTEPNFIGFFKPTSINYNPMCPIVSDELLKSIWEKLR